MNKKYPYKYPYKFWWFGIKLIRKYKTVACYNWYRWKERKGNDGSCWLEEPPQFPRIFSFASHYRRIGKNEIPQFATSSSPEISTNGERTDGVWWLRQIKTKNLNNSFCFSKAVSHQILLQAPHRPVVAGKEAKIGQKYRKRAEKMNLTSEADEYDFVGRWS